MALCVGIVIIGGIKSIAATTSKLVPGMALLYIVTALVVILINCEKIPEAYAVSAS